MRIFIIMVCAIILLSPDSASAECTSPNTPLKVDLTSLIAEGKSASMTQTFTIDAGCTQPFYIAITATPAKGQGSAAPGFENTISYRATASIGDVSTAITTSTAGAGALKVVSQQKTTGVKRTVPIVVTVSPRDSNNLLPGNYAGHLSVSVCERTTHC